MDMNVCNLSASSSKVIAIKTHNKAQFRNGRMDHLVTTAKLIRDASDITPFPYIKGAATVVVGVLEIIQNTCRNQDDLDDLATELVEIIVTIRDTLRSYCESPPTTFKRCCEEFVEKLLRLSSQLNDIVRITQSWTRYFKTTAIRDKIMQSRRQIDGLRANFTLMAAIHIELTLKIYIDQLPRQLGYTWQVPQTLCFIDAMNVSVNLPMDLCHNQRDFNDLIRFMFRRRRGRRYVERGDYNLINLHAKETVKPESWTSQVTPGSTIVMHIIFHHAVTGGGMDDRWCPSCAQHCNIAFWGDETNCSSCGTSFLVTGSVEEPTFGPSLPRDPASLQSPTSIEEDKETFDVRYFRRFHVVLKVRKVRRRHTLPRTTV